MSSKKTIKAMKIVLSHIITLITGALFIPQVSGQTRMSNIDSVAIVVPNMKKNPYKFLARAANISELIDWGGNVYQFCDNGSKEIQYGEIERKFVQYKADPVLRNIGDGAMTLIMGVGFNTISDGKWEIAGKIICNDTLFRTGIFLRIVKDRWKQSGTEFEMKMVSTQ